MYHILCLDNFYLLLRKQYKFKHYQAHVTNVGPDQQASKEAS